MNARTVALLPAIAVLLVAGSVQSAESVSLFGAWAVDVAKLPNPDPPKSVAIVLAEVGGGSVKMTVDIVSRDGATSHAEATFKLDGTVVPVTGSADVDIVSMRMPNPRTLIMGAGMAGRPSNTRVFAVSDDGTQMTETVVGHDQSWTPFTRVNTWSRK